MQSRHMLGNKQGLNSNSCRSGLIKTFLTIGFTIDLRGLHRIIYSTVYQKARTAVQQQAELRLYLRGSVADIFTLKSKYGWQEENKTVHRVEIATSEDARQALEELKLIE